MEYFAKISIFASIVSTILVIIDLFRAPQRMRIMNAMWVLTALWAGVAGLVAYLWFGRKGSGGGMKMGPGMGSEMGSGMDSRMGDMKMGRPRFSSVVLSTLHCGAGCTLGDIVGAVIVMLSPVIVSSSEVLGSFVLDYFLALCFGVVFQYCAIRPMVGGSTGAVVWLALRVDFLSLSAWQLGMYGWMIFCYAFLSGGMVSQDSWEFWFMMQQAMFVGFLVALPVNYLLIRCGVKSGM